MIFISKRVNKRLFPGLPKGAASKLEGYYSFDNDEKSDLHIDWQSLGRTTRKEIRRNPRVRSACAEVGFFNKTFHIDKMGIYEKSSFHHQEAIDEINNFKYEHDVLDLIREVETCNSLLHPRICKMIGNKPYEHGAPDVDWPGVIFAHQNAKDASTKRVGGQKKWFDFFEKCCKFYGKDLFIKFHPAADLRAKRWRTAISRLEVVKRTADKYGCSYGWSTNRCIDNCDHVVLGTSAFAVDCMLRGVLVKQGMGGYFHGNDCITFCDGDPSIKIKSRKEKIEKGKLLANFLARKYCFPRIRINNGGARGRINILKSYADSKKGQLFPLPSEYSYYSYLSRLKKEK